MYTRNGLFAAICFCHLLRFATPLDIPPVNIVPLKPNVPFSPSPLPPSHETSDGEKIIELFQGLSRDTVWDSVDTIAFEGNVYEPEGIVRLGPDRWIVSAGQWTVPTVKYLDGLHNGTDRTVGAGFAHIIVFDGKGKRVADVTVTERGTSEYHTGGIDYDGQYIWATIAEYRPNSTGHIARFDPKTLQYDVFLRHNDHIGGVVHDTRASTLYTLNWGSRKMASWSSKRKCSDRSFTAPLTTAKNPSHYIDYQDCKFLSSHSRRYGNRPVALCSGVAIFSSGGSLSSVGGLALVDMQTMLPLMEIPLLMKSSRGSPVTLNPMEVGVSEAGKLRLYFLPDRGVSHLYVFEAK